MNSSLPKNTPLISFLSSVFVLAGGLSCSNPSSPAPSLDLRSWTADTVALSESAAREMTAHLSSLVAAATPLPLETPIPDLTKKPPFLRAVFPEPILLGKHRVASLTLFFGPSTERPLPLLLLEIPQKSEPLLLQPRPEAVRNFLRLLDTFGPFAAELVNGLSNDGLLALRGCAEKLRAQNPRLFADVSPQDIRETTWPNSALGFPEPGHYYAQVLVPGYRVFFRKSTGGIVECHTGGGAVRLQKGL
ncbi:MAG: hypothetical protein D6679_06565 [Candidatus Hydrogenedentota bacterium]|nr:MAG: hypothetical protein D6679_06565 [Candidatus Hydrogenedentota bacterium]